MIDEEMANALILKADKLLLKLNAFIKFVAASQQNVTHKPINKLTSKQINK